VTREPVYDGATLIGHKIRYPAVFITVRDQRGYDSFIQAVPAREVFEPLDRQPGMFDDD
jgi:hypothetical protein